MDAYQDCTEEDMKEEIVDLYDTEVWEDLVESVEN